MPDKRTSPSKPVNGVVDRPTAVDVGQRLRELRTGRGLSIRVLAELSQLNVNTLSLIENNKTSPSVSTLQQLAAALEVPITAFFESDLPKNSLAHLTADRRPRVALIHGLLEDLSAGLTSRAVQPFVLTLEPHADSGPQPIVHTGLEFVYCLRGQISYQVEDRTFTLGPGDSLLFESHLPHRWQNAADAVAQVLLVLCPADERDRPTERHFALKGASESGY
ncbi:MAG: cupin domain-containing protein [Chloroflexi bacterium]|nr:cupin domain-containing protein [Chloroflexota bacterium]